MKRTSTFLVLLYLNHERWHTCAGCGEIYDCRSWVTCPNCRSKAYQTFLEKEEPAMTLSFTEKIKGKPNHFVPKIWRSFLSGIDIPAKEFSDAFKQLSKEYKSKIDEVEPKKHTIREDQHNRWSEGTLIHPVINNRTSNRFQFAPTIKCTGTQKVVITWLDTLNKRMSQPDVFIDGKICSMGILDLLAINDGFDSTEDFFDYFSKDFTGKIIHWTNFKY